MTFAFDNRAKSGFARGEGVGVIILKSVKNAIDDNDRIRSVIVNSGVGQDGRTVGTFTQSGRYSSSRSLWSMVQREMIQLQPSFRYRRAVSNKTAHVRFSLIGLIIGITSPSGKAQEQLMRDVYQRANISPKDVGFVEAHGQSQRKHHSFLKPNN